MIKFAILNDNWLKSEERMRFEKRQGDQLGGRCKGPCLISRSESGER